MDKPEPLSDEEITAIWNRFIKQPYDGRTLSAIISHTAQAVAARYEARIAELERERDALRVDAERYRHLRDSGDTSIYVMRFDIEGDTPVDGPDLDASIDAARAGHLHETLHLLLKADLENEIARHMASILEPMANDVRTLAMYLNLRLSSDEIYRDKES